MAMRLMDRIATLLKADAHGVVESLEDRALLLKQYVREAELDLNRKRARSEALREECKRLEETRARCEAEIRSLEEDVGLALRSGKEDLARFSIRRLIPRRAEAEALRARLEQCGAEERALGEQLTAQQRQLEQLRGRVRAELLRPVVAEAAEAGWPTEAQVAEEEVELELMRRRQAAGGPS